jgi:hypothetical protein
MSKYEIEATIHWGFLGEAESKEAAGKLFIEQLGTDWASNYYPPVSDDRLQIEEACTQDVALALLSNEEVAKRERNERIKPINRRGFENHFHHLKKNLKMDVMLCDNAESPVVLAPYQEKVLLTNLARFIEELPECDENATHVLRVDKDRWIKDVWVTLMREDDHTAAVLSDSEEANREMYACLCLLSRAKTHCIERTPNCLRWPSQVSVTISDKRASIWIASGKHVLTSNRGH